MTNETFCYYSYIIVKQAVRQRYRTLNDYFEQTGETHQSLADRLGVTAAYVSMMRAGKRQPSLGLALKLHEETGVPMEALLKPEETLV